jgi:hypothetical protein
MLKKKRERERGWLGEESMHALGDSGEFIAVYNFYVS